MLIWVADFSYIIQTIARFDLRHLDQWIKKPFSYEKLVHQICFVPTIHNKQNPLFYCCSRIRFQIPVFELCKIWIKKLNNYSTTEWFSAKRHKVKHRKSWKLLNWDQLQSDFPSLWMGISSWEVHNIIRKGQTNLPTWAKLILSQPFAQTPGRTKNSNFKLYI